MEDGGWPSAAAAFAASAQHNAGVAGALARQRLAAFAAGVGSLECLTAPVSALEAWLSAAGPASDAAWAALALMVLALVVELLLDVCRGLSLGAAAAAADRVRVCAAATPVLLADTPARFEEACVFYAALGYEKEHHGAGGAAPSALCVLSKGPDRVAVQDVAVLLEYYPELAAAVEGGRERGRRTAEGALPHAPRLSYTVVEDLEPVLECVGGGGGGGGGGQGDEGVAEVLYGPATHERTGVRELWVKGPLGELKGYAEAKG
eukprot:Rhum_TRINITY_DN14181_c1_g2::Rhum_TRINITY_DN14181_c1_g2_i1::g.72444::m.72444